MTFISSWLAGLGARPGTRRRWDHGGAWRASRRWKAGSCRTPSPVASPRTTRRVAFTPVPRTPGNGHATRVTRRYQPGAGHATAARDQRDPAWAVPRIRDRSYGLAILGTKSVGRRSGSPYVRCQSS